ncbi:MAG: T9SS C-terminal target domain-containing protein, partial [Candidatus Zixiibacteriota bacterium]
MFRKFAILMLLVLLPVVAFGQISEVGKGSRTITDADIVGNTTFHADTIYTLDGFVFVENGEVLTIEPGTIVKANPGQGVDASALIVARGGKIIADGSASAPIIFTSALDDLDDPNDIPYGDDGRGLWGGLIVLGYADINTSDSVGNVEGLPGEPRTTYGGTNNEDSSGVLRYVSVRHGGSVFGDADEINGITMGAVGSKTVVDYVEVFQNIDDGIEFFGGTVNIKHFLVAFCGDDAFDIDEGYSGAGQFLFSIQDGIDGDCGGEHDGGTTPEDGTPYATNVFSNVTYLGAGLTPSVAGKNPQAFNLRDNWGGAYYNSIFHEHAGFGLAIEDLASGEDSRHRLEVGDLMFQNNCWGRFAAGYTPAALANGQSWTQTIFTTVARDNWIVDPGISCSRLPDGHNDPRPKYAASLPNWTNPAAYNPPAKPNYGSNFASFFEQVNYIGAFDPDLPLDQSWAAGWTAFDFYGYLGEADLCACGGTTDGGKPEKTITDASINGTVTFHCDTVYVLDGFVFVESGEVLNIEPGTIIKGLPGQGVDASALIVARGGRIFANGTPTCPVVFTSYLDEVDDVNDIPFGDDGRGLWGGLIVLGYGPINTADSIGSIEGLPGEPRTTYGGLNQNPNDQSGELRYVSVRHGGSVFGDANEINGITMGAVGRGTFVDHVEVFQNLDDGIEFFGGTVNIKNFVVAFCGDDSYDIDEGYSGAGQFLFAIQDGIDGDCGGEHDGGTTPEDGTPYATNLFSNVTYLGGGIPTTVAGKNPQAFNLRDNWGGAYYNSIFSDHNGFGLAIEDLASGQDSRARLE